MNAAIWHRVQALMADILQTSPAQITLHSSPDTLETWDSVNHLNLVLAIEQEFKVRFTPEEIEQLASAERITGLLQRKLDNNGSSNDC
jgi:acyl carrier protein